MVVPKIGTLIKAYDGVIIKDFILLDVVVGVSIFFKCERVADHEIIDVPIFEYVIAQ